MELSYFQGIWMDDMSKVKVLLADSQYLIRMGVRHLISNREDMEIVAEAINSQELLEKAMMHGPDVIVFDYNDSSHFQRSDIAEARKVSPESNFLVISSDENRENINHVLENGVNSFLTKECDEDEILSAIKATAKNEKFFCNKILNIILEKHLGKEVESCEPTELTVREVEIVKMIAEGNSTKDIADQLHLSHHTIYTHRKNVMKKLSINSVSELILYAINTGLVNPN